MEFRKNPVGRSGSYTYGLTDGKDDGNSHCSHLLGEAQKIVLCFTETYVSVEEPEHFVFCGNMAALTAVHKPPQKSLAKVRRYIVHVISTVHLFYIHQRTCFSNIHTSLIIKGFVIMVILFKKGGMWRVWKDGNEHTILVGEHGGELRGNRRIRQEDNIKMYFKDSNVDV